MTTSKFYLADKFGNRISLNVDNSFFLKNVYGLGISSASEFDDLEQGFFVRTQLKWKRESITGDIVFIGDAYSDYKTLIDWIASRDTFYFVYSPMNVEYFREVQINYVTKMHRGTGGQTEMPIAFTCLSPWFKPLPVAVEFADSSADNYFTWGVSSWGNAILAPNTSGTYSAEVEANGHMPASIKLTFVGSIENPTITLKNLTSDEVLGKCKLTGIYSGTLVLDTSYRDSTVTIDGEDCIDDVDLAYEPFFRIPVGEDCSIEIESPEHSGTCEVEIYEYYRSV